MIHQLSDQFNELIKDLFEDFGYDVEVTHGIGDGGVDLIVESNGRVLLSEVKVYRTKYTSGIENALARLYFNIIDRKATNGVLILSSILEKRYLESLQLKYGIRIIDRNILFFLTQKNFDLRRRLEEILLELTQTGDEDFFEGLKIPEGYEIEAIWTPFKKGKGTINLEDTGKQLSAQLSNMELGKERARGYEMLCEKILKYLFEKDFSFWNQQNSTDDTLHRFDLIAKIASMNDLWKYLARDFRSRFVIFEFKNHTDPITQSEVYSTEKYLFNTALRSIAVIISRKGADKNANIAMKGALRENGKLIICLNDDEILQMLHMKDNDDDPNTYLSEKIDKILMNLSR